MKPSRSAFTLIELLAVPGDLSCEARRAEQEARRAKRSMAFTLIELLVVIGILAVLLAIALPAFTGLGGGVAMQGSVSGLRSTLTLARQWAITKRVPTYVVFYDAPPLQSYAGEEGEVIRSLRAYSVFAVTNAADNSGEYIKEITMLPAGILFGPDDTAHPLINPTNSIFSLTKLQTLNLPDLGVADYPAVGFSPDGSLLSDNTEIYLVQGSVSVDTNSGTLTSPPVFQKDNGMLFSIDVYKLTGHLRVRDYNTAP